MTAADVRAEIQAGRLRGSVLRDLIGALPRLERESWVDDVLGMPPVPPTGADLPRGGVPYLRAGVDEILAWLDEATVTAADLVVDLGCGMGRVLILAHLLTGAHAQGVEIQAELVAAARERCVALGLSAITIVHANAEEVELDGSVFFLYSPFNGAMLTRVLGRIEEVAKRRSIRVCTVDFELHDVPWLRARPTASHALTIYDSVFAR